MLMLRIGEKLTCRGWKVIQHFLTIRILLKKFEFNSQKTVDSDKVWDNQLQHN